MRKLSMWLLGSALLMAAAPTVGSANGVSVTAFGGAIVPTGTFGDETKIGAKVGYQVGGSLDYMVAKQFAIGVGGSFNKDKGQRDGATLDLGGGDTEVFGKAEFTTVQADVHGKYLIPVQGPLHPYAVLGLGLYRTAYKEEGTDTFSGVATPFSDEIKGGKQLGGKLGVGANWALTSSWAVNAEAAYHVASEDKDKAFQASSFQYVGLTAGLTWMIPAGSK